MSSEDRPLLWVLDTHVLIWYFTGNRRLPDEMRELIDQTRQLGGRLLVPTIALAEALGVAAKGRIAFDFHALYQLVRDEPEFEIVDFGAAVFEETVRVEGVSEIHDRIIVATARFYGAGLLTVDGVIRASGATGN